MTEEFTTEEFIIEGRNAVLEAFRAGKTIDKLYAVSYTHLDVYKRQAIYPLLFRPWR